MIEAIVLAAGLSRRMGTVNKLTLSLQGKPLLIHTIEALLSSEADKILVIVGHESEKIEALLQEYAVEIIYNEHYEKGQLTSIQKGLSALSKNSTGFMICLSDMPLLTDEDYNILIQTYYQHFPEKVIVVPERNDIKGNPKIFHPSFAAAILALDPTIHQGAKAIVQQYSNQTILQAVSNEHFFIDIDNLSDYQRLNIQ